MFQNSLVSSFKYFTIYILLTVVCVWDYFRCIKKYGKWPPSKDCCTRRLKICRKHMKLTKEKLSLGPDYTSSPLTVGDRWITWPEQGTPPTIPSNLISSSVTTQAPKRNPTIMRIPTLKGMKAFGIMFFFLLWQNYNLSKLL